MKYERGVHLIPRQRPEAAQRCSPHSSQGGLWPVGLLVKPTMSPHDAHRVRLDASTKIHRSTSTQIKLMIPEPTSIDHSNTNTIREPAHRDTRTARHVPASTTRNSSASNTKRIRLTARSAVAIEPRTIPRSDIPLSPDSRLCRICSHHISKDQDKE